MFRSIEFVAPFPLPVVIDDIRTYQHRTGRQLELRGNPRSLMRGKGALDLYEGRLIIHATRRIKP